MTTLKEFERIIENIHKLEIVPNDLRVGGDMNKPRVRAELDKLDIHETEDGLGDYMLGILSKRYFDYPDEPTPQHLEWALEYFEKAAAKGYAAAVEELERIARNKAEKEAADAERKREREELRIKWKWDNPFFPFREEFEKKPADDWEIEKMRAECAAQLGVEPPEGYVAFVNAKDGFTSQGREIYAACSYSQGHVASHNEDVYVRLGAKHTYWKEQQAEKKKRYFFVGRSGGGYWEWVSELGKNVNLPWEKYYAYDYKIKRYVRLDAETGDIEESYSTFTEMFKAIWSGVITEDDYREKLPEVEDWSV